PRRVLPNEPLPEIPDFRISIINLLVGRVNPLGLEDQLRIGPQKGLYRNEKLALRDNFIFFGLTPKVHPALIKVGPSPEIQPLSVLNLKFTAEFITWFGSFNYMQSFGSPLEEYSDSIISARGGLGQQYRTSGGHFTIEPLV